MTTQLNVDIGNSNISNEKEIEIFSTYEWNMEIEEAILRIIPELLSVIRNKAQSLNIKIFVETKDPRELNALIRKKQKNELIINDFKLTSREREVLKFIMNGYTNQEIAEKLSVSYETIRSHRKNILQRTGCRNTASLVNAYHIHA